MMSIDDLMDICGTKVRELGITKQSIEISLSHSLLRALSDVFFLSYLSLSRKQCKTKQCKTENFEMKLLDDLFAKLEHYQHRENLTDQFFNRLDIKIKYELEGSRRRNLNSIVDFLSDKRITRCVDLYEDSDKFLGYVFNGVVGHAKSDKIIEDGLIEMFTENMSSPEVIETFNFDEDAADVLLSHSCHLSKQQFLELANAISSNKVLQENSVLLFSKALMNLYYDEVALETTNPEDLVKDADKYLAALKSAEIPTIMEQCQFDKPIDRVNYAKFLVDIAYITKESSAVLSAAETLKCFNNEKTPRLQSGIKNATMEINNVARRTKDAECTTIVSNALRQFVEKKELKRISQAFNNAYYSLDSIEVNRLRYQKISDCLIEFKDNVQLRNVTEVIIRIPSRFENSILEDTISTLYMYKDKPTLSLAMNTIKSFPVNEYLLKLINKTLQLYAESETSQNIFDSLLGPKSVMGDARENNLGCLYRAGMKDYLESVDELDLPNVLELISMFPGESSWKDILESDFSESNDPELAAKNKSMFKELVSDYQRVKGDLELSEPLKRYYHDIYFEVEDQELKESLTYNHVINLMTAYTLIEEISKDWSEESSEIVKEAFLTKLNANISTGANLSDKKRILTGYCNNVTRGIQDNVEDFRLVDLKLAMPDDEQGEKSSQESSYQILSYQALLGVVS